MQIDLACHRTWCRLARLTATRACPNRRAYAGQAEPSLRKPHDETSKEAPWSEPPPHLSLHVCVCVCFPYICVTMVPAPAPERRGRLRDGQRRMTLALPPHSFHYTRARAWQSACVWPSAACCSAVVKQFSYPPLTFDPTSAALACLCGALITAAMLPVLASGFLSIQEAIVHERARTSILAAGICAANKTKQAHVPHITFNLNTLPCVVSAPEILISIVLLFWHLHIFKFASYAFVYVHTHTRTQTQTHKGLIGHQAGTC